MKRILAILLLIPFVAAATNVRFSLFDFGLTTPSLTKRTLVIDPLSTVMSPDLTNVITSERRYINLGTNPVVTVSNMVYGSYLVSVWGTTRTSQFRIYLPLTNAVELNAGSLITASGNNLLLEDGTYLRLLP